MDYIHWNMHKRITVRELAEHVGLTPSYLSVLFKEKTGMSVSEYIRQKKISSVQTDSAEYGDDAPGVQEFLF